MGQSVSHTLFDDAHTLLRFHDLTHHAGRDPHAAQPPDLFLCQKISSAARAASPRTVFPGVRVVKGPVDLARAVCELAAIDPR